MEENVDSRQGRDRLEENNVHQDPFSANLVETSLCLLFFNV